jgi:hypothetical protein
MKMYTTILLALCLGCTKIRECRLELNRFDYNSEELSIQGYYYTKADDGKIQPQFIFYRNGVIKQLGGTSYNEADLLEAEASWLEIESINFSRNKRINWGIFHIFNDQIVLEIWSSSKGGAPPLYRRQGSILNDSTFILTSYESCEGYSGEGEDTYYFKNLAVKPDSTNTVIE